MNYPQNQFNTKDIIQYLGWLNRHREIDRQWFFIVKGLIIQHRLSILFPLRNAFQRLAGKKCEHIFKLYKKQYLEIYHLVIKILTLASPDYTLRSLGLIFLQNVKLKYVREDIVGSQYDSKQSINFLQQELKLYRFVYESKKVQWQCKRKMKIFEDFIEFRNIQETIRFSVVQEAYQLVNSNYRKRLSFFQVKFLDQNYTKYRQCKAELQKWMKKNEDKILPSFDEQTQIGQTYSSSLDDLESEDSLQILNAQEYEEEMKKKKIERQGQKVNTLNFFQQLNFQKLCSPKQQLKQQKIQQIQDIISTSNEEINSQKLCCRPFFIKGEVVGPESRDVQYKNYNLPWSQPLQFKIGKTICGFLNSNGGNIYIGIDQNTEFQRKVVGRKYTEAEKEETFKTLRQISQTIKPDILSYQLFDVNFIPVMNQNENSKSLTLIKNCYVIKVSVHQGINLKLYTIINRQSNSEEVCIRTWNEIICYKNMHEALGLLEQRMKNQFKIQKLYPHENPCNNEELKRRMFKIVKRQKRPLKTNIKLEKRISQQEKASVKSNKDNERNVKKAFPMKEDNLQKKLQNTAINQRYMLFSQMNFNKQSLIQQKKEAMPINRNQSIFRNQKQNEKQKISNYQNQYSLFCHTSEFEAQHYRNNNFINLNEADNRQKAYPPWIQEKPSSSNLFQ